MAEPNAPNKPAAKKPFLSLIQSGFAALFGIQSDKNRVNDFKNGNPKDFIAIGLIGVTVLVFGMAFIVHKVISHAPAP